MNRFVLVLTESYDCYDAQVPHPIVTKHSREEIHQALVDHLRTVKAWFDAYKPGDKYRWDPPYISKPLLDTGLTVSSFEVGNQDNTAVLAEILTVDEWFEQYSNRRFN